MIFIPTCHFILLLTRHHYAFRLYLEYHLCILWLSLVKFMQAQDHWISSVAFLWYIPNLYFILDFRCIFADFLPIITLDIYWLQLYIIRSFQLVNSIMQLDNEVIDADYFNLLNLQNRYSAKLLFIRKIIVIVN